MRGDRLGAREQRRRARRPSSAVELAPERATVGSAAQSTRRAALRRVRRRRARERTPPARPRSGATAAVRAAGRRTRGAAATRAAAARARHRPQPPPRAKPSRQAAHVSDERAPGDPVVVPGADVVEVPQLEGPVDRPDAVGRPHLVDAVVVEQAALGSDEPRISLLRALAELAAEPLADRGAEALLLAVDDVVRDERARRRPS